MRWIAKAFIKQILSYTPGGERLDYLMQRYVTRKLPHSQKDFSIAVGSATSHFDRFLKYKSAKVQPETAQFYEFGAGWELTVPFTYYLLGVRHQILTDIRLNLRIGLINAALSRFQALDTKVKNRTGTSPKEILPSHLVALSQLQDFGITYRICDAAKTDLPPASVDFISSTTVLEHVPATDILQILLECRRLLKPGGILSANADLKDHFSDFDGSITPHNYLRFSEKAWRLINSPLLYQNRLRPTDYLNMVRGAGLELLTHGVRSKPIANLKIHKSFSQKYEESQLSAVGLYMVARKPH